MGSYNSSNARSYRRDDYEDDYDQDDYEQPRVAQRPRANVPDQFYSAPQPQYVRPGPLTRTVGGQPTPRQNVMPPAPMPTMPVRTARPPAPRAQTGSLRAPSMRPARQQSRLGEFLTGLNIGQNGLKVGLMLIGGLVALLVVYFLVSNVVHWWQTWQDDMTYGRPRTVQTDQFVGHSEEDGTPSHFIIQNNNRQITVVEYPGGDVTKTKVIPGPRLFGKDMELAPVKARFEDVNADGHVDMILSVDSQEIIYINEKSNFRPITSEERNKLSKVSGGSK